MAVRTDSHTRGCSPVPGLSDRQRQRRSLQAPSTSPGWSALMVAKTVGSTPRESPSGCHWAATLHTTSWLSLLSVGVERRGGLGECSEEPAWQERACMQNSRNVKQLSSTIDIYIYRIHVGVTHSALALPWYGTKWCWLGDWRVLLSRDIWMTVVIYTRHILG